MLNQVYHKTKPFKKRLVVYNIEVPVEIFSTELSPAESLTKYLKEQKKLSFSEISRILNRDQRGIWGAYQRALKKQNSSVLLFPSKVWIPVNIFQDRKFAVLEMLVIYLKENNNLKINEIADMLDKSKSTVWTVFNRARKKRL